MSVSTWSNQAACAIITTFRNPTTPRFYFERFYALLEDKGFVIYGGKTLHEETFRIATIGRLFPQDVQALLEAICTLQDEGAIGTRGVMVNIERSPSAKSSMASMHAAPAKPTTGGNGYSPPGRGEPADRENREPS